MGDMGDMGTRDAGRKAEVEDIPEPGKGTIPREERERIRAVARELTDRYVQEIRAVVAATRKVEGGKGSS